MLWKINLVVLKVLNCDILTFTFFTGNRVVCVWFKLPWFFLKFISIDTDMDIKFFLQLMRKLVRYILSISTKRNSISHNFSMFYSPNMVIKQANLFLQHALKFVLDQTPSTMPNDLVRSKWLCTKRKYIYIYIYISQVKVNELYIQRPKSWQLTNHSMRIVMPNLQNGSWFTNFKFMG